MLKTYTKQVNRKIKLYSEKSWTPKLHENPIRARFIIFAPKCLLKPLSKAVIPVLTLYCLVVAKDHMYLNKPAA